MSSPPVKKQKFQNKKKFYQPNRRQYLEAGHKGFIATCNFNEKDCVRECYNLLNEFAYDLYGPEEPPIVAPDTTESKNESAVTEDAATDDIADELKKEIDVSQRKAKIWTKRRFQCVDTGATNCVFIKTTIADPVIMADHIVRKISEAKKQKTRYLLRLVPVELVCKANENEIVNSAGQLCDKYFLNEPTTFSIVFNKRFNNDVNRDSVIREIADLVHAKNVMHKVDLKHAKKSIIVEVIKGLCCLSVVTDYMALRKYNLVELARANPEYEKKELNITKTEETSSATNSNKAGNDDPEKNEENSTRTEKNSSATNLTKASNDEPEKNEENKI